MSVKTVQAIINGQTYNLTLNSHTGKYEATVTAPARSSYSQSGHYYPVTVKATDDAGNITTKDASDGTLGKSLQLVVKEKVAPVSAITYPTSGAFITNATPVIAFKVTDEDSGINESTIKLTVDGSAVASEEISKKAVSGGYECTYTPEKALGNGAHTIKVEVSDHDGNAAAVQTVSFTVDTVPPTLSVTAPHSPGGRLCDKPGETAGIRYHRRCHLQAGYGYGKR